VEGDDLQTLIAKLQSELNRSQAEAAESHQANLTLAADLAVMERKQKNQVGLFLHIKGWLTPRGVF
jgi:hypothetical protein